jgi:radical SAM superfamily enzyme YgiQ (UPF0313 family)
VRVLLISTYELGHQPFGLASPAAWLKEAGAEVTCLDLAVQRLDLDAVAAADLIAFYVPMHTATRIAASIVGTVRRLNPSAHLCYFGLYAATNADLLKELGADTILGGEFEGGLVTLARSLSKLERSQHQDRPDTISLAKQAFIIPDRSGLPALDRYAYVALADGKRLAAGYTEASRGCKHLCRHCPIPPVYGGVFRVVQPDIVLADVAQQVEAGAQHITFGDPDFFNGPGHAVRLVQAIHERFPALTYDVTIKVEHLLKHAKVLPVLRDTGCLFVTSAVESIDDSILARLEKRHTLQDFLSAVGLLRDVGLVLNPTFVAFTPWTTIEGYVNFLEAIATLDLVECVSPIQYAIRLLIPAGSRLLEMPDVEALVKPFDRPSLVYPWLHPDPRVDRLGSEVLDTVASGQSNDHSRHTIFDTVWRLANAALVGTDNHPIPSPIAAEGRSRAPVPHLSEAWYC